MHGTVTRVGLHLARVSQARRGLQERADRGLVGAAWERLGHAPTPCATLEQNSAALRAGRHDANAIAVGTSELEQAVVAKRSASGSHRQLTQVRRTGAGESRLLLADPRKTRRMVRPDVETGKHILASAKFQHEF
jgi:hypothetical protein